MNCISLVKKPLCSWRSIIQHQFVQYTTKRHYFKPSPGINTIFFNQPNLNSTTTKSLKFISTRFNSNKVPEFNNTSDKINLEGRLAIRFTCKVCQHVNMKTMSKQAYQEGVVLIQCDGCDNRHLIADNLGWFRDNRVNIEDIARENGEKLARFDSSDPNLSGLFEFTPSSDSDLPKILGDKSG